MKRISSRFLARRVYGVTWTCARCGKVFTTETQYAIHILTCGSR